MATRVNPNVLPDLLVGIEQAQQQLDVSDQQLASGQSINKPSDNPAGASALVINENAQSVNDTFQTTVGNLQGTLQIADSALNSGVTAINQAISLGVEAGNSDLSASDRQAIANQLSGIQQQLVGLANTTSNGTYLFAGTQVKTQPFTLNASSASGVTYSGNSSTTSVEITNGESVNINVPGDQLFLNPSGSVFGAINSLISAVQSGNGISSAVTALGAASSQFNSERLNYGTSLTQLQSASTLLGTESVQLSTQESTIDGANLPAVTTQFNQAQIAYESLLSAEGRILQLPNLLNFIE